MKLKNKELKIIFICIVLLFSAFLIYPMLCLLLKSFIGDKGLTLAYYQSILLEKGFLKALFNSFKVASISALITTAISFFLAYTICYTRVPGFLKKMIQAIANLPMLLPTLTYGFALIYSFGKQGLLTKLFGHQLFEIYGFNGLLIGYIIYTLPISFMLIYNTMGYIDKKFMIVSRLMKDNAFQTFKMTILRPLLGTLAASFIQAFFLCFTDFGIPASVGGKYEVVASVLYTKMLGSVPDFHKGSVVAMIMLLPSIISILVLRYLEKYNIRYNKISNIELQKNKGRDGICAIGSSVICLCTLSIFAVIFLIPFVQDWPYNLNFSMEHIQAVFADASLFGVFKNSLFVAFLSALFGTLIAYGAALVTSRSQLSIKVKRIIEGISSITNTIPGMVLGLAFLFSFSGTSLQSTFTIIILCNIIHFFSTPYLMMHSSLSKMNASWETTAMLMKDHWIQTIIRVVTPNAISTILEVFSYYFINAMVTVSAVIFIAGAKTMVMTTKIKELQYYNKFNEVFVLSLLMLATNLLVKVIFQLLSNRKKKS